MKVRIEFCVYACIINSPDRVGLSINKYAKDFTEWMYDKKMIMSIGLARKKKVFHMMKKPLYPG